MADQEFVTETPAMKAAALKEMRQRLSASAEYRDTIQQLFKRQDCDDFLLRFIRAKKFDNDRAFKNLMAFIPFAFEYRLVYSDLSCRECDEEIKKSLDLGQHEYPGPKAVDKMGRQIIIVRPDRHEPWTVTPAQVIQGLYFLLDKALMFEHCQSRGVAFIGYTSETDMRRLDRPLMKSMSQALSGTIPIRVGPMLLYKPPAVVSIFLPIMKAVMSAKLVGRLNLCKDDDTIRAHVNVECLPECAGGAVKSTHAAFIRHYHGAYNARVQRQEQRQLPPAAAGDGYSAPSSSEYSAPPAGR